MGNYSLALSEAEVQRYRFMAEAAVETEREQWTAAGVKSGADVADVGCGPGAVSAALAGIVAPKGTVYAVDRDPEALKIAAQLVKDAGATNVHLSEGGATESGLSEQSVDVVMMRHVLAHNGGREQEIVDHLTTLARPGGAVYLVDVDATAMRVRTTDAVAELHELMARYAEFHAELGNDLSVGLRLGELLENAGLTDIDHRGQYDIVHPPPGMRPPPWAAREQMLDAGLITKDDIERWEAAFERLDRGEAKVTLFAPKFTAWGRKPG